MLDSIGSVGSFVPHSSQIAPGNFALETSASGTAQAQSTQNLTFYSPSVIKVDPISHIAIFEQRDPETGQITHQYPSEQVVDEYRKLSEGEASPASIAITNFEGGGIPANALASSASAPPPVTAPVDNTSTPQPPAKAPSSDKTASIPSDALVTGKSSPAPLPPATDVYVSA